MLSSKYKPKRTI